MSQVYKIQRSLRFRESDPAQIMFFGNMLGICHDAFEDFLSSLKIPWESYFASADFIVPIRKTECEFFLPVRAGQTYQIEVKVRHLGDSSFTMAFTFLNEKNERMAEALISHVFVDAKTKRKMSIPSAFRAKFELFLESP